jgi:hypothetical protein
VGANGVGMVVQARREEDSEGDGADCPAPGPAQNSLPLIRVHRRIVAEEGPCIKTHFRRNMVLNSGSMLILAPRSAF